MSLYQKYRPESFKEVVGNKATIDALTAMHLEETHAYAFYGPAGCGKTTIGRILAKELGCHDTDFVELDSADFRGIDTIRSIRRQVDFKPAVSKCRVWLLDEAHMLTGEAANALLKVLEEPPPWVYFIICTTNPQKLLKTIRSRCSEHNVYPLDEKQMFTLLRRVVKAEGGSLARSIYEQIAQDSLGHPRQALTVLEQVLPLPPEKQADVAAKAASEASQTLELCKALLSRAPWKKIARILSGLEEDPESVRRRVLNYCQSMLLKGKSDERAWIVMDEFISPFYDNPMPQLVLACGRVVEGEQE